MPLISCHCFSLLWRKGGKDHLLPLSVAFCDPFALYCLSLYEIIAFTIIFRGPQLLVPLLQDGILTCAECLMHHACGMHQGTM